MKVATVRWPMGEFKAEPIRELAGGSWEMRAMEHTMRFSPDTIILVHQDEILSVTETETEA